MSSLRMEYPTPPPSIKFSKIKQKSSGFLMAVNQQLSRLLPPNLSTVEVPSCHNPRPAKLHFKLKTKSNNLSASFLVYVAPIFLSSVNAPRYGFVPFLQGTVFFDPRIGSLINDITQSIEAPFRLFVFILF